MPAEHATTRSLATWADWCADAGLSDVYWRAGHFQVWMDAWDTGFFGMSWRDGDAHVLCATLLDPLDVLPHGAGRFHAKTPYDFGGPRTVAGHPEPAAFATAWCAALASAGVITEFARLHPFHPAPPDAVLHAENLVVDLSGGYDAVRAAYHGSWRRDLQKAERTTAAFAIDPSPSTEAVDRFSALYDLTMDRVDAAPWYRFDRATFRALLALDDLSLATVTHDDEVVAAALLLASGDVRFYHLSASVPTRRLWPNHLLLDGLIRHALADGARAVHLGAGAPALRRFKSRVANSAVPYHLVRRVLDPAAVEAIAREVPTTEAFPPFLGALDQRR
jgi:hypothetical protein